MLLMILKSVYSVQMLSSGSTWPSGRPSVSHPTRDLGAYEDRGDAPRSSQIGCLFRIVSFETRIHASAGCPDRLDAVEARLKVIVFSFDMVCRRQLPPHDHSSSRAHSCFIRSSAHASLTFCLLASLCSFLWGLPLPFSDGMQKMSSPRRSQIGANPGQRVQSLHETQSLCALPWFSDVGEDWALRGSSGNLACEKYIFACYSMGSRGGLPCCTDTLS
jgi:hypothetical protein